jgi:hypothetical protein
MVLKYVPGIKPFRPTVMNCELICLLLIIFRKWITTKQKNHITNKRGNFEEKGTKCNKLSNWNINCHPVIVAIRKIFSKIWMIEMYIYVH